MKRPNRQGNARSSLKRKTRTGDPMVAYDRLPAELRSWLAQAVLPWSVRSVFKAWRHALHRSGGDVEAAKRDLARIERTLLKRDHIGV